MNNPLNEQITQPNFRHFLRCDVMFLTTCVVHVWREIYRLKSKFIQVEASLVTDGIFQKKSEKVI